MTRSLDQNDGPVGIAHIGDGLGKAVLVHT